MTLSLQEIRLRPAIARAVEKKARDAGKTTPEYVRLLIEREILAGQSFDEILGPIRSDFRRSGISAAELDRVVERARTASRRNVRRSR
jgi:hypothetical protein